MHILCSWELSKMTPQPTKRCNNNKHQGIWKRINPIRTSICIVAVHWNKENTNHEISNSLLPLTSNNYNRWPDKTFALEAQQTREMRFAIAVTIIMLLARGYYLSIIQIYIIWHAALNRHNLSSLHFSSLIPQLPLSLWPRIHFSLCMCVNHWTKGDVFAS